MREYIWQYVWDSKSLLMLNPGSCNVQETTELRNGDCRRIYSSQKQYSCRWAENLNTADLLLPLPETTSNSPISSSTQPLFETLLDKLPTNTTKFPEEKLKNRTTESFSWVEYSVSVWYFLRKIDDTFLYFVIFLLFVIFFICFTLFVFYCCSRERSKRNRAHQPLNQIVRRSGRQVQRRSQDYEMQERVVLVQRRDQCNNVSLNGQGSSFVQLSVFVWFVFSSIYWNITLIISLVLICIIFVSFQAFPTIFLSISSLQFIIKFSLQINIVAVFLWSN